MNRRKRDLRIHADGSVWDHDALTAWLDSMVRPRVTVERLSKRDPFCQSVEAASRERVR